MRLSLRTLLAFEDNVFDVEQHRRLEQLLHTDVSAEAILQRIRSVVRNPMLGVPGLLEHQEELDPNYVAEYLDHQMPNDVQEKFEAYCLSADKYIAEIASVHHLLSNVLGEPARTSRECRLKCYDTLSDNRTPLIETKNEFYAAESPKHFRPYDPSPESNTDKPTENRLLTIWKRLFPSKAETRHVEQQVPAQKSSLWTFCIMGLFVCALLFGWKQIEKRQTLRKNSEAEAVVSVNSADKNFIDTNFVADNFVAEYNAGYCIDNAASMFDAVQQPYAAELPQAETLAPPEQIAQAAFTTEHIAAISTPPLVTQVADTFDAATELPQEELPQLTFQSIQPSPLDAAEFSPEETSNSALPSMKDFEAVETEEWTKASPSYSGAPVIAFHAIKAPSKPLPDALVRQNPRPSLPTTTWQPSDKPIMPVPALAAPVQHTLPHSQPIMQTSAAMASNVLGRVESMGQPSLIFTAVPSQDPRRPWQSWQLPPLPFDLHGEQYLLTAAPFVGTLNLAAGFRIEMIGDTKLCVLPMDVSGVPGIFVDYGRIIIRPLKPNQPLRIETAKSRGTVSINGTESVLFIDTFAKISAPPSNAKPTAEQKSQTGPLLGFVPKNGEQIAWKLTDQPQPLLINSQGSVLLHSNQYRIGVIQRLPIWLGTMPIAPENRMLVDICRRCFAEAEGHDEEVGERALARLIRNESRAVRTLGFRLWGDLGEFKVPLAVLMEQRQEDEEIRRVLEQYFYEVRQRDEESLMRFDDAVKHINESRRN